MKDTKVINFEFLNGRNIFIPDRIGSGEMERHHVRFIVYGQDKIENVKLLFGEDFDDDVNIIVRMLSENMQDIGYSFSHKVTVYFDIDEKKVLENYYKGDGANE